MAELVPLQNGEVVLYKRERTYVWQARIRLADKSWLRLSTRAKDRLVAANNAIKRYYDTVFKHEHKLPQNTRRFDAVASSVTEKLREEIEADTGKRIYKDYINSIDLHLSPTSANKTSTASLRCYCLTSKYGEQRDSDEHLPQAPSTRITVL